ncbi:hypothetical protein FHX74_001841 [Friedmanniella endophytica]|uniref:DUF3099 domain-containing protein n=1 Tax=Microlunatus kandeliicorticis TaxID=1759536 RepID=A0A7W3IS34_9ACTN|nr:DUF3099 domain-containing protein [Microlunatus kandeliicorticis]MBA8794222.1 hypothetical protein [Microlunatus kandeliicorticis]
MAVTGHDARQHQPNVITTARSGNSREFAHRQRQYVIAMGIRTLCFLLSTILFFTHVINGWVCAVLFIGAVFLPSVAVAIANQSNTRHDEQEQFQTVAPADARQLTTGPEPEVVEGTVEDDFGTVPPRPTTDRFSARQHVPDDRQADDRGAA